MSLLQLRTFVEVYRRRSLSEAARAIGITQPAASQHIASLEAQLGRPLFDRHSRGVRPTAIADDLASARQQERRGLWCERRCLVGVPLWYVACMQALVCVCTV